MDDKRVLQQDDCKNVFYNALLPDDERIIVRPPIGDPAYDKDELWLMNKTLYGLRRSPMHWYNMFAGILKNMQLVPSDHDPCLYSGIVNGDNPASGRATLHVGIYVDNFVFYLVDPEEKEKFKTALGDEL